MGLKAIGRAIAAVLTLTGLVLFHDRSFGSDQTRAKHLLQQACVQCHRLEGTADSRFNLLAPDLIWARQQISALVAHPMADRQGGAALCEGISVGSQRGADEAPAVTEAEANAIADYFEKHNMDPRVKVGAFDVSKISKFDATFGGMAYKAHACLGCHTIEENGRLIGGPQSTALQNAGQRYNLDWLYRFGQNPQDFIIHTGEFLADATNPQLRAVIGFLAIQGVKDFKYYEPWTSQEFANANVDRGKVLYKEYCAQCYGFTGKGDGPAAAGLEPKPAIHANMPFEKLPMEYLYNVINHGGPAVGKSPNMPYWGLTIGPQGVADVIAYVKVTFKGIPDVAATAGGARDGACVQPRKTAKAPKDFLAKARPLSSSPGTIKAGKELFLRTAQPIACMMCHGEQGDGNGLMGAALAPPPRNFTCGTMMKDIPDGQLFWIIKNGSPGTGMMSFASLPDEQVWQLIHYIRSLAK